MRQVDQSHRFMFTAQLNRNTRIKRPMPVRASDRRSRVQWCLLNCVDSIETRCLWKTGSRRSVTLPRKKSTRRRSSTRKRPDRITMKGADGRKLIISGEFPEPPEPFDPRRDWDAWKQVLDERPLGGLQASAPLPESTPEAVDAVQATANASRFGEPRWPVDSTSLKLAAILTVRFGDFQVFGCRIGGGRYDYLLDALNCYPHPESTACRWLVPAIRNLASKHRETPEDLWNEWAHEGDRLHDLILHPRSARFQGSPPGHAVLDYEETSSVPPASRANLGNWRIRAHVLEVPKAWDVQFDFCTNPTPRFSVARLNILTHFVAEALNATPAWVAEQACSSYREFLFQSSSDPSIPLGLRQRLRDTLVLLNEAAVRGLAKRYPLRLYDHSVREYDSLLPQVRSAWKTYGKRLGFEERGARRLHFLEELGWDDSGDTLRLLGGVGLEQCTPREAAALLLCMREDLGLHHPQTVFEALAEARKVAGALDPKQSAKKRRGRPPRRKNI